MKVKVFSTRDLVSFGEYLLSPERAARKLQNLETMDQEAVADALVHVSDVDLEEWLPNARGVFRGPAEAKIVVDSDVSPDVLAFDEYGEGLAGFLIEEVDKSISCETDHALLGNIVAFALLEDLYEVG